MSEIEKMARYIERTKVPSNRYQLYMNEVFSLIHWTEENPINAVIMAFEYGQAKGYRAAKAEVRG